MTVKFSDKEKQKQRIKRKKYYFLVGYSAQIMLLIVFYLTLIKTMLSWEALIKEEAAYRTCLNVKDVATCIVYVWLVWNHS